MKLIDNWKATLLRASSVRLAVLSAVSAGGGAVLTYARPGLLPEWAAGVLLCVVAAASAAIPFLRILKQESVSGAD